MRTDELRQIMRERGVEWAISEEPLDVQSRLGYLPSPDAPALEEQERIAADASRALAAGPPSPDEYDLRNVGGQNFVTPIRDQGMCGSCVAFGCCAAVESTLRVQTHRPDLDIDLSEAHLFYCVALAQGRSCDGPNMGWQPTAALDALRSDGTPDEACFPYSAGNQPCAECADWQPRATKITGHHALNTPAEMKAWISSHGPLVASMTVYEDFQHYRGGIYRYLAGGRVGGHCVCIVGYSDPDSCWIGKNSWGDARWGETGFFRIGYGECGIDSAMLAVEGVTRDGLDSSSRR